MSDRELFKSFIEHSPSDSCAVCFLRDHDFGASYRATVTDSIFEFIDGWNNAEHMFIHADLESYRSEMLEAIKIFANKLACSSGSIRETKLRTAIPDMYLGSENWPDFVDARIKELNQLATSYIRDLLWHAG